MSRLVLLIDDNDSFRRILARELGFHGCEVLQAASGDEALALAHDQAPAEVILDMRLGDESGLLLLPRLAETLRVARGQGAEPARIVVLTGYASINTAVEAVKKGAHNYVAKPATVEQVLAAFDSESAVAETPSEPAPLSVRHLEWEHLQRVLAANEGNVSATARALGMHRRTLQRKLAKKPGK